jgi:hypothetical protein
MTRDMTDMTSIPAPNAAFVVHAHYAAGVSGNYAACYSGNIHPIQAFAPSEIPKRKQAIYDRGYVSGHSTQIAIHTVLACVQLSLYEASLSRSQLPTDMLKHVVLQHSLRYSVFSKSSISVSVILSRLARQEISDPVGTYQHGKFRLA